MEEQMKIWNELLKNDEEMNVRYDRILTTLEREDRSPTLSEAYDLQELELKLRRNDAHIHAMTREFERTQRSPRWIEKIKSWFMK